MQSLGPFNPLKFNNALNVYDSEEEIKGDGTNLMRFEAGHEVSSEPANLLWPQSNSAHSYGRAVQRFLIRRDELAQKVALAGVKTLDHQRHELDDDVKILIQDRKVSTSPISLEDCRALVREYSAENLDLIHQAEIELVEAVLDCDEEAIGAVLKTLKRAFQTCFKNAPPGTWIDKFDAFLREEINDVQAQCASCLEESSEELSTEHDQALDQMDFLIGQELSELSAAKEKSKKAHKQRASGSKAGQRRLETGSAEMGAGNESSWLTRAMKAFQTFLRSVFNLGNWTPDDFEMANDHELITNDFINAANGVEGYDQKEQFGHFNLMLNAVMVASHPEVYLTTEPESGREDDTAEFQAFRKVLKSQEAQEAGITEADYQLAVQSELLTPEFIASMNSQDSWWPTLQFVTEFAAYKRVLSEPKVKLVTPETSAREREKLAYDAFGMVVGFTSHRYEVELVDFDIAKETGLLSDAVINGILVSQAASMTLTFSMLQRV